jgi:hypothetical protein
LVSLLQVQLENTLRTPTHFLLFQDDYDGYTAGPPQDNEEDEGGEEEDDDSDDASDNASGDD